MHMNNQGHSVFLKSRSTMHAYLYGYQYIRWDDKNQSGESKGIKTEKNPPERAFSFPPSSLSPGSPWCTSSRAGSRGTPWATGWSHRRCFRPAGSSRALTPGQRLSGSAPARRAWPGAAGAEGACQTSDPRWRWNWGLPSAEQKKKGRE